MTDTQQLAAAAVAAAREARRTLAEAMHGLEGLDGALAEDLAFAVAALFRVELDEAEALLSRLREAAAVVSGVLSRLHAPELVAALDVAGPALAKTLAILYPARAGLERALVEPSDGASQPDHSPPAMPFERPLVASGSPKHASFPRPAETSPVLLSAPLVSGVQPIVRSERPTARDPLGARRQASEPPERPTARDPLGARRQESDLPERPSARLRRNAVSLRPDAEVGLVDEHGKSGSSPPERRVRDRAELTVDIGVHSESQFFAGISGDLSEGGLFVATYVPQPVGTELFVSFVLPGGTPIKAPVIVAWVRGAGAEGGAEPGMGLRFFRLEDRERQAIERYLKVRPPMLYQP